MIDCIIVDDEEYSIDILLLYAKQIPDLNIIKATTNPMEAMVLINTGKIQLAFCDIQMPDISGLDIAKAAIGKCKLIFTTAYSDFAINGYEHDVIDYLLKPISFPRFLAAFEKANKIIKIPLAQTINEPIDSIYVKTGAKGKLLKISFVDIDYIKSDRNYITIHHKGNRTMVNSSMKEFGNKLPFNKFLRIHKSYIVALANITGIEGNKVLLKNIDDEVLLSDTYRTSFFETIQHTTLD